MSQIVFRHPNYVMDAKRCDGDKNKVFFVSEREKEKGKFESEKLEMDERKKEDYLSVLKYE